MTALHTQMLLLLAAALLSSCRPQEPPPLAPERVTAPPPAVDAETARLRALANLPPLLSPEDGSAQFRIGRDAARMGPLQRFFFEESGVYRYSDGRVERVIEGNSGQAGAPRAGAHRGAHQGAHQGAHSAEMLFDGLPLVGTVKGRLAVNAEWAAFADDKQIFVARRARSAGPNSSADPDGAAADRVPAAEPFRSVTLQDDVWTLSLHPEGLLVTDTEDVLHLLDLESLETKWSIADVQGKPLAQTRSSVFVLRRTTSGDAFRHFLVEFDVKTGKELHKSKLFGRPVGRVIQDGNTLSLVLASAHLELAFAEYQLDTHAQRQTELGRGDSHWQLGFGTHERLTDKLGAQSGVVVALRREDCLHFLFPGKDKLKLALPEDVYIGDATQLFQLGQHLYVIAGKAVVVIDPWKQTILGTIRLHASQSGAQRVQGALALWTSESFMRLIPEDEVRPPQTRIIHEPWRFGEPSHATDGDPKTLWEFPGDEATFRYEFTRPTVVSRIEIHLGDASAHGSARLDGAAARNSSAAPNSPAAPNSSAPPSSSGQGSLQMLSLKLQTPDRRETTMMQSVAGNAKTVTVEGIWVVEKLELKLNFRCNDPGTCRSRVADVIVEH